MDTPAGIIPTYECTLEIRRSQSLFVGTAGFGTRVIGGVDGGTVTGDRITGEVVGPGADWVLLGGDGYGRVDVRLQVATHDGALIYVQYLGLLEMNAAVTTALTDRTAETTFDDQYFVVTPRMECGDSATSGSTRPCSSLGAG